VFKRSTGGTFITLDRRNYNFNLDGLFQLVVASGRGDLVQVVGASFQAFDGDVAACNGREFIGSAVGVNLVSIGLIVDHRNRNRVVVVGRASAVQRFVLAEDERCV